MLTINEQQNRATTEVSNEITTLEQDIEKLQAKAAERRSASGNAPGSDALELAELAKVEGQLAARKAYLATAQPAEAV